MPERILLTTDTLGGVWTYSVDLAGGLGDLGVQVALATMGAPLSRAQRHAVRGMPHVEVYETRYRLEWMADPWNDVEKAGAWLVDLEQTIAPDVVHLNQYAFAALPFRAPVVVVGHSCVTSWFDAVHDGGPPSEFDRYRTEVARGLRNAGVVISPTRDMLLALRRHYGPLGDVRVIPNGIARHHFRPKGKEPFVLAAGRLWDPAKNVDALAKIAGQLPWPVKVAGDFVGPTARTTLPRGVDLLGVLPRVELADWMGRASIFAHPARYEPFGLAPLEAAASGCVLVLGDIPSLREVWDDAAVYVPPADPIALAECISRLTDDLDRRTELSRRAFERSQLYDARTMAAAYHEIYRERIAIARGREGIGAAAGSNRDLSTDGPLEAGSR